MGRNRIVALGECCMESVQKQITDLNQKVAGLFQAVEQIDQKISIVLASNATVPSVSNSHFSAGSSSSVSSTSGKLTGLGAVMEHKDILVDSNSFEGHSQSSEKDLAPEIKIQRLTAQLTAAYNRIAALEEQLLQVRVQSTTLV